MDRSRTVNIRDLPLGSLVGIIRVRDETDFDFEGSDAFNGQELQSLAAQIVSYPAFKPAGSV
jgi:hypothetical protein